MADSDRIRLDADTYGDLDDVVVRDVSMFRAERMNADTWWVCCYLDGNERITWNVTVVDGRLQFDLVEGNDG